MAINDLQGGRDMFSKVIHIVWITFALKIWRNEMLALILNNDSLPFCRALIPSAGK